MTLKSSEQSISDLLPCPFCSATMVLTKRNEWVHPWDDDCPADGIKVSATVPAKVEAWNRRASACGGTEPAWFAVQSVTGTHIGMWNDERIARRVFEQEYPNGKFIPLYASSSLSPASVEPDGWKLVPVRPTIYMLEAADEYTLPSTIYRAMLSEAPTPPALHPAPLPDVSEELRQKGTEFLEAAEAVFDWMNGNDLSADHEEQRPDDFRRVSDALVAFRAALAASQGAE